MIEYKYCLIRNNKVEKTFQSAWHLAIAACNHSDWKNIKMETNNETVSKTWIHMEYNKEL